MRIEENTPVLDSDYIMLDPRKIDTYPALKLLLEPSFNS